MVQYFKSCIILIVIFVSNCNSLHNNMETFEIHGLVAPVFTAFKEDGTLDINKIAEQASWLNSTGVKWVFTNLLLMRMYYYYYQQHHCYCYSHPYFY